MFFSFFEYALVLKWFPTTARGFVKFQIRTCSRFENFTNPLVVRSPRSGGTRSGCNPRERCGERSGADFATTVSGLAKVAIFTTNVDAENQTLFNQKMCLRSTEPPLLPNPCYKLAFCPPSFQTIVNTTFHCLCRVGLCGWVFFIFRREGDFF